MQGVDLPAAVTQERGESDQAGPSAQVQPGPPSPSRSHKAPVSFPRVPREGCGVAVSTSVPMLTSTALLIWYLLVSCAAGHSRRMLGQGLHEDPHEVAADLRRTREREDA